MHELGVQGWQQHLCDCETWDLSKVLPRGPSTSQGAVLRLEPWGCGLISIASCCFPAASCMVENCFPWITILSLNYFDSFDGGVKSESIVMSSLSLAVFRNYRSSRMVTIRLQLATFLWHSSFQRMASSWTATSAELCMSRDRQIQIDWEHSLGIFLFFKKRRF